VPYLETASKHGFRVSTLAQSRYLYVLSWLQGESRRRLGW